MFLYTYSYCIVYHTQTVINDQLIFFGTERVDLCCTVINEQFGVAVWSHTELLYTAPRL